MRPSLLPADTSLETARVYYAMLGRLPPRRRMELMLEADEEFEKVVEAGVRRRHPDYSHERVRLAMARMRLGPELFRKVFPDAHVEP